MVEPANPDLSIGKQCRLLSISRSSFYYAPKGETALNLMLMRQIDEQFLETPFFGVRQMTWHLRNEGHLVNEKRIRRLMRLMGLMPIYQKPNTSKAAKGHKTYPYLLRGLRVTRPNQVWAADITYLPMYRRAILGLGYLPQETSIFRGMTVEQNINSVLEVVEPDRATREQELERLLDEFGLSRLRESPAMALSGGERRRCEIARALAAKPSIMLLDEPFAGVDPISVSDIRDLVSDLKTRGIGVLITDHNVRETLEIVDRAYILHDGKVLMSGTANEVISDANVKRVYLGDNFKIV